MLFPYWVEIIFVEVFFSFEESSCKVEAAVSSKISKEFISGIDPASSGTA